MDSEKYNTSIGLHCPTCGGTGFEYGESDAPITCAGCDRLFTREELIHENGEVIESALDEIKAEIVKDVGKELRDSLRKAFQGSKHIRFK